MGYMAADGAQEPPVIAPEAPSVPAVAPEPAVHPGHRVVDTDPHASTIHLRHRPKIWYRELLEIEGVVWAQVDEQQYTVKVRTAELFDHRQVVDRVVERLMEHGRSPEELRTGGWTMDWAFSVLLGAVSTLPVLIASSWFAVPPDPDPWAAWVCAQAVSYITMVLHHLWWRRRERKLEGQVG